MILMLDHNDPSSLSFFREIANLNRYHILNGSKVGNGISKGYVVDILKHEFVWPAEIPLDQKYFNFAEIGYLKGFLNQTYKVDVLLGPNGPKLLTDPHEMINGELVIGKKCGKKEAEDNGTSFLLKESLKKKEIKSKITSISELMNIREFVNKSVDELLQLVADEKEGFQEKVREAQDTVKEIPALKNKIKMLEANVQTTSEALQKKKKELEKAEKQIETMKEKLVKVETRLKELGEIKPPTDAKFNLLEID